MERKILFFHVVELKNDNIFEILIIIFTQKIIVEDTLYNYQLVNILYCLRELPCKSYNAKQFRKMMFTFLEEAVLLSFFIDLIW